MSLDARTAQIDSGSWDPPTSFLQTQSITKTIGCASSVLTSKYSPTRLSMALTVHLDRRPRTPTCRTCRPRLQITSPSHGDARYPRFGTSCVCRGDFRRASQARCPSCTAARRKSRSDRDGGGKGQPTRGRATSGREGYVAHVRECGLDPPAYPPRVDSRGL
jgi:hypothetical protein